jgi:hypothetical protein
VVSTGLAFTITFAAVATGTLSENALIKQDVTWISYSLTPPDSSATFELAPSIDPTSVAAGGGITVDIAADSSVAYTAAETVLTYDPALVEWSGTDYDDDDDIIVSQLTASTLKISAKNLTAPAGAGTLATLTFAARNPTETTTANFSTGDVVYAIAGNVLDQDGTGGSDSISVTVASRKGFVAGSKLAPDGYKVFSYKISADEATKKWTYSGNDMHNIVIGGQNYAIYIIPTIANADSAATPVITTTAYPTLTGDVNGNGKTNIVDAQIALDLANGGYDDDAVTLLTVANRLAADVNGDGLVTSADARAIQYYSHYNTFTVVP